MTIVHVLIGDGEHIGDWRIVPNSQRTNHCAIQRFDPKPTTSANHESSGHWVTQGMAANVNLAMEVLKLLYTQDHALVSFLAANG